jgi:uncharacterized protein YdaU (DUF1376 family)
MNYYPFHIGDYLSATRHLSWAEDAAYRRLLDTYYTTEKALPLELRAVCRLVLATTEEQREAVRVVLDEFFEQTEEGWKNSRADAEIDAMRGKQQKQRDKANKRWHKPEPEHGNASAMPRHTETDAVASKTDADAMPPTPTPTPTPQPSVTITFNSDLTISPGTTVYIPVGGKVIWVNNDQYKPHGVQAINFQSAAYFGGMDTITIPYGTPLEVTFDKEGYYDYKTVFQPDTAGKIIVTK